LRVAAAKHADPEVRRAAGHALATIESDLLTKARVRVKDLGGLFDDKDLEANPGLFVQLTKTGVTGKDLALLRWLPVVKLILVDTDLEDDDLEPLSTMTSLRVLYL